MMPLSPETPSAQWERADAIQRERLRVADVLHNTVCQELTGICLMASAAAQECRSVNPEAEAKLKELARLIQQAGAGLHEFVRTLRAAE